MRLIKLTAIEDALAVGVTSRKQPVGPYRFSWLGLVCLLAFSMALGGCVYHRVVKDGWASFREIADKPARERANRGAGGAAGKRATQRSTTRWAILLEAFSGPGRFGRAIELIRELTNATQETDVWVQDAGQVVYVYWGRYDNPKGADAQTTLQQTRDFASDGHRRFVNAELTPVTVLPRDTPTDDPQDLRRYRGMYTLQIGYYDDAFGSKFRRAAVKAAHTLQRDGQETYFYHGPHRSLVTVGLFSDEDFMQRGVQRVYGPVIRALQAKFPNNLGNGVTMIVRVNGIITGNQPSFLVRVF